MVIYYINHMKTYKETYTAQALAIIMIILIVSSIIGFSVFIRSIRDKKSIKQERESAEAYEVVDMILDNMLLSTSEQWEEKMSKDHDYINEDIKNITNELEHELDVYSFKICPLPEKGSEQEGRNDANRYTLVLKDSNGNEPYEIRPSQAFTFVVDGLAPANCSVSVTFHNPPTGSGFMLNKIYRTNFTSTNIKEYDYKDAETYCLNPPCTDQFRNTSGDIPTSPNPLTIPMTETEKILDRIQIIAINYPIWITYTVTEPCGDMFNMLSLRASATCNSVYRAKEVLVPKVRSNYSIFNYVLFNGKGELSPYQQ